MLLSIPVGIDLHHHFTLVRRFLNRPGVSHQRLKMKRPLTRSEIGEWSPLANSCSRVFFNALFLLLLSGKGWYSPTVLLRIRWRLVNTGLFDFYFWAICPSLERCVFYGRFPLLHQNDTLSLWGAEVEWAREFGVTFAAWPRYCNLQLYALVFPPLMNII